MLQFLKDRTSSAVPIFRSIAGLCPVGVDMGNDALSMAQLADNGRGVTLVAGDYKNIPPDIKAGSVDWQRWAIDTIRKSSGRGQFRGRDVIAAISPAELFIDHIRMPVIPKMSEKGRAKNSADSAVISKIKQKLPFDSANALIRYIPAEEENALVIAAERKIIDRHLAIYEKAGLTIKSIGVWPVAMAKSYARFFGRRQADSRTVVFLLDIKPSCTNVVICRHENPLLARSIPLGAKLLDSGEMVTRFVMELDACRRHFTSLYRKAQIDRLVFLSGRAVEKEVCVTIAKKLEMPAQMGDCLMAVQVDEPSETGVERRDCQAHWAIAFGLSLS